MKLPYHHDMTEWNEERVKNRWFNVMRERVKMDREDEEMTFIIFLSLHFLRVIET